MNVPLSVQPIEKNGKEYLNIWADKKQHFVPSPIKPYFYSREKLNIKNAKETIVRAKALSTYKEVDFYKYEFKTRNDLVNARDKIREVKGRILCEDNIRFDLRNRIDNPDLYTKYAHTKPLDFFFIDIEQHIKPRLLAPTDDDRITAISWCGNDRKIKCGYLGKDTKEDVKLLKNFLKYVDWKKVDVLCLYNKSYDMPTIIKRCWANRIETKLMSKNNQRPTIGGDEGVDIPGITIYDVYDSVHGDQSLNGNVPNRGLKAVSDYHEFETDVKVLNAKEITELQGTKELIDYNKDDVKRLLYLFDIYYPTVKYKAESLKIPINLATNLSMTDLGIIVLGDLYRKHNIISDGDNYMRHPEIFQRKKKSGEPNFQGAIVDIKKTGRFKEVKKADFSSLYPTCAMEFNLGPDTTKIIRYDSYSEFKIEEKEDCYVYHIPDNVLNKNIVIQVLKEEGFLRKAIKKFLEKRSVHKKKYKETGDKAEKAKSDIYKVFANGAVGYGNHGAAHHPFGYAPMAIATVGFGREAIQLLIDSLDEIYPNSVIELDTDGIYTDITEEELDEKKVIDLLNEKIKERFGRYLGLTIDFDHYKRGYFYAMKNYVLETEDGELILHGGALKSSRKCKLIKNLITDVAWAKIKNENIKPIVEKYKKFDFPVEHFAMSVTMGMHPNEYKNQNGFVMKLAKQGEKYFDIKPSKGNQYHYIKVTSGYKLVQMTKKKEIDKRYYNEEINKVIELFDFKQVSTIDEWI